MLCKKKIVVLIIFLLLVILLIIAYRNFRLVSTGYCAIGDTLREGKDFENCICIGQREIDNFWEEGGYGVNIKCKGLMIGIITREWHLIKYVY